LSLPSPLRPRRYWKDSQALEGIARLPNLVRAGKKTQYCILRWKSPNAESCPPRSFRGPSPVCSDDLSETTVKAFLTTLRLRLSILDSRNNNGAKTFLSRACLQVPAGSDPVPLSPHLASASLQMFELLGRALWADGPTHHGHARDTPSCVLSEPRRWHFTSLDTGPSALLVSAK
jgi:hypothetical protein